MGFIWPGLESPWGHSAQPPSGCCSIAWLFPPLTYFSSCPAWTSLLAVYVWCLLPSRHGPLCKAWLHLANLSWLLTSAELAIPRAGAPQVDTAPPCAAVSAEEGRVLLSSIYQQLTEWYSQEAAGFLPGSTSRAPAQSCCHPITLQGLFLPAQATVPFFCHGSSQHSCQILPTLWISPSEWQLYFKCFGATPLVICVNSTRVHSIACSHEWIEVLQFPLLGAPWHSMNH